MTKSKRIILSTEEFEVTSVDVPVPVPASIPKRNPYCPNCGDDWDGENSRYKCGSVFHPIDGTYTYTDSCHETADAVNAITDDQIFEMAVQLGRYYNGESLDTPVIIPTGKK